MKEIEKRIWELITECFQAEGVAFSPAMVELPIMELGVDSLGFAIIVAKLDRELGIDPFTQNPDLPYPRTLREFVDAYIGN